MEAGENFLKHDNRTHASSVAAAMQEPSEEDIDIDRQWREVFGQPLPMLGASKIALMVLEQYRNQSSGPCDASR